MECAQCAESSSIQYSRRAFTTRLGRSLVSTRSACRPDVRRGGPEAEHIVVRHVVRNRNQIRLQILGIVKAKELAPGQLRDRFGGLVAQRTPRSQKGHCSQPQRRSQLADAVEHLLVVMAFIFGIGALAAEASMRGPRSLVVKFGCLCETAARVLENAKLYMAVLVSLMRRRASVTLVLLPWSVVSLSSKIARR